MANYRYYLGPPIWVEATEDDGAHYRAPEGVVGWIDLRTIPDQSQPAAPQQCGFFASTAPLGDDYDLLGTGDLRDLTVTSGMLDTWEGVTGYRPSGVRLVDLLHDHLTMGADPDGLDQARP